MADNEANAKMKPVVNNEQQTNFFDDLIIEEILLRLPIKSSLRFKSVSKQWYSTLTSSNFINAHFNKTPSSDPSSPVDTLFIMYGGNYYLFPYDDDDQISPNTEDNLVKLSAEFAPGEQYTKLTGCCNGLICLSSEDGNYFAIWNPATRKKHTYMTNRSFHPDNVSGFGYASSTDDYKYIRISTSPTLIMFHIFSLREKRWRRKLHFNCQGIFRFHGQAALIDETLYWYAILDHDRSVSCTVCFDIGFESFYIFTASNMIFGDMGGCLSVCNCNENFTGDKVMHIMAIEEPNAIPKSLVVPNTFRLDKFSQMIGFTRTGKFFMTGPYYDGVRYYPQALGIVNIGTKPLPYTTFLKFRGSIKIARYVPSLVSPFLIQEPSET